MNQVPLDDLNPPQREAVLHEGSPLLVLAGAGSGKTRVVTYRIARLILDRGVSAGRILAVTFTNKAAREMTERIAAMAGGRSRGLWIGTFHAMCARLLRRHADRLGYPREFTIYDTDEQRSLIRKVVMNLNWDSEKWQPAKVQSRISHAKNHLITPEMMAARGRKAEDAHLAEIYERYLAALKDAGAMDFDDLLLNALGLFTEHEDLKGQYQNQFEHVIVDEYQDTNEPQDSLTKILAEPRRNLCVVGDDDQSIYRWRGAQFKNILQLPKVYPDLRIIRLERNYRSTTQIIKAAQAVIANNRDRHGKDLFTEREEGAPVGILSVENEEEEARRVAEMITEALREEIPAREIAVLYRTNAQSRVLEEALVRAEIPYRVVGGLAFYQRKEIKTLLSYLRLLVQPHDDLAFLRIVNYPRRGIGETTLRQLQAKAGALRVSLFEAAKAAANFPEIAASGAQKLQAVCLWINRWTVGLEERPLADTLRRIIEETEFEDALRKEEEAKADSRIENVHELVTALIAAESSITFEAIRPWENGGGDQTLSRGRKLEVFLERVTLEADSEEEEGPRDVVSLMTLHAAKGLEFKRVFMTGLEEGLFPHAQSSQGAEELEEERRLCYVGMTRAKDRLVLSHAFSRKIYGSMGASAPSRFLAEIPEALTQSLGWGRRETSASGSRTHSQIGDWATRGRFSNRPPRGMGAPRTVTSPPGAAPASAPPKPPRGSREAPAFLHPGKQVRHRTFGIGRVLSVEGEEPTWRVTVDFKIVGPKTLLQKYARLEPA